jgi:LacI family transcriptional regulator
MVTIYDIARHVGVAPSTVSKALNGKSDVNVATRSTIISAASELGYLPSGNSAPYKQHKKRSMLIGVVYETNGASMPLNHPLFLPLIDSFKRKIEDKEYELLFLSSKSPFDRGGWIYHCYSRQVDSVLLVNYEVADEDSIRAVLNNIPVLSCHTLIEGMGAVIADSITAGIDAIKYLYSLGHERIGHIAGPIEKYVLAGKERLDGYKRGIDLCGLGYDESLVQISDGWTPKDGAEAMARLLKQAKSSFTAVFFASDNLMLGGLRTLRQKGIVVPKDLSIVGFDGDPWTVYIDHGYSTFAQQKELMGETAANILLAAMNKKPMFEVVRIPVRLIARGSCRQIERKSEIFAP